LKRVRIGGVMLGDLPPGQWRYLRGDETFAAPPVAKPSTLELPNEAAADQGLSTPGDAPPA
jgi:hypothetical protein